MGVHVLPGKAGQELREQQHERAEHGVLRGRVLHIGQRGQISNKSTGGNAAGQVVCGYHGDQRVHIVPLTGQPGKQQIAGRAQDSAQHQDPHHAPAQRHGPAGERAQQGHQHAVDFGHCGHFVLGVAHVHIKGIGHDAHHHVADPVGGDQGQNDHRLRAVAPYEVGKGLDHRAAQPIDQVFARGQRQRYRFLGKQHRGHAGQHAQRHGQVSDLPRPVLVSGRIRYLGARRNPQRPRARPDHRDAVAGLVRRGQRGLVVAVGGLNTECVQRNVLRGRAHSNSNRAPDHRHQ